MPGTIPDQNYVKVDFVAASPVCSSASSGAVASSTSANEGESVYTLKDEDISQEFYEKNSGSYVTVRILKPKPIDANSVTVRFYEQSMVVSFKTNSEQFLSKLNQDNATTFVWQIALPEKIVPDDCNYACKSCIEIDLKKNDQKKKWPYIVPPAPRNVIKSISSKGLANESKYSDFNSSSPEANALCDFYESADGGPPARIKNVAFDRTTISPAPMQAMSGFTGLRNMGNTCFMNATLQALVNTVELKIYFDESCHFLDINVDNVLGHKGKLAESFGSFMKEIWNNKAYAMEPAAIRRLVSTKASQFANFAQHDSQEFLSFLLDGLHEDLNRVVKKPITETIESDGRPDSVVADLSWNNYKLRNDSIIVDLFHGQMKSRVDCPECKRISITFDPFVCLPVPFPKPRKRDAKDFLVLEPEGEYFNFHLTELLEFFTEKETLDAQEAWYCDKCKKHQEAEKTLQLWQLPPVLIVQLKRFCYTSHILRNKIDSPVIYPVRNLNMSPYMCPEAPKQETNYDLYAVVCHSGTSYFGHYVSYARLPSLDDRKTELEWRRFDDTNVSTCTESSVVDNHAYLLFYKRCDNKSSEIVNSCRNKKDLIAKKKLNFETKSSSRTLSESTESTSFHQTLNFDKPLPQAIKVAYNDNNDFPPPEI